MATHCSFLQSLVVLIGRILFSALFIVAGLAKIMHFSAYLTVMTQHSIPMPEFLLVVAIVVELLGGVLVFLGLFARFGAFLLFIYIIPVTFLFNDFWTMTGPEMVNNIQHWFKDVAIMGGALYIMAFGPGCVAFDALRHRQKRLKSDET